MKKLITVRQALEDPAWLGGMLGAPSFAVMRDRRHERAVDGGRKADLRAAARKRRPKPLRNFGPSRSFFIERI
jgi:hypothetical protein